MVADEVLWGDQQDTVGETSGQWRGGNSALVRVLREGVSKEATLEMNWEVGIDIYTLICIKQITNKNLLYKK